MYDEALDILLSAAILARSWILADYQLRSAGAQRLADPPFHGIATHGSLGEISAESLEA